MSFHQAIVEAFYAAARPLAAEDLGLDLLGQEIAASYADWELSVVAAQRELSGLRDRLESAVRALWDSDRQTGDFSAAELDKLIDYADRRASSSKSRCRRVHERGSAGIERLRSLGVDDREATALTMQLRTMEDLEADAADAFVRFYYELLAFRAAMEAERPSRTFSDVKSLLADLRR
jgi:hypothetical protein